MYSYADMKLKLTQCGRCLGCNRLEDLKFTGDNKCKNAKIYTGGKAK